MARTNKIPCDSVGILTNGYSQIIAFRDESCFLEVLEANPNLQPLYGTKDYEKQMFPGLYIAGYTNSKIFKIGD